MAILRIAEREHQGLVLVIAVVFYPGLALIQIAGNTISAFNVYTKTQEGLKRWIFTKITMQEERSNTVVYERRV